MIERESHRYEWQFSYENTETPQSIELRITSIGKRGLNMEELMTQDQLDQDAKELCKWAAARAGVIVVAPLVGSMALIANEVYMISRLAKLHGKNLSDGAILGFIGAFAGTIAGQTLTTLIPFAPLQIPIGMGVTYALGIAAHEWMKAGCPSDMNAFQNVFDNAKEEVQNMIPLLKQDPRKALPLGDESKKYLLNQKETAGKGADNDGGEKL